MGKKKDKDKSLLSYKKDALRISKQLRYSDEVRHAIESAETEGDIARALIRGRKESDRWAK